MPDGTTGRGFVNGGLTWSFEGPEVNSIKDDDLFVAYCGWAWLFPPLAKGTVKTHFASSGEGAKYLARKREEGLTGIEVIERYKIGTTELTGFRAKRNGTLVQGAGDTESEIIFPASDQDSICPLSTFFSGSRSFRVFIDTEPYLWERLRLRRRAAATRWSGCSDQQRDHGNI
jgi:hypothetical protein